MLVKVLFENVSIFEIFKFESFLMHLNNFLINTYMMHIQYNLILKNFDDTDEVMINYLN